MDLIYQGYPLYDAILRRLLVGGDLTAWLQHILNEGGCSFGTSAERETVRDIKEKLAYGALNFEAELRKAATTTDGNASHTLPNGAEIVIADERFRSPELLFKPSFNGFVLDGLGQTLFDSIMECDTDVRKDLYANIVLSGGMTMFTGLSERVDKEITHVAPATMKIKVVAAPERKHGAWIGGSILASFLPFPQMVITQEEEVLLE